MTTAVGWFDLLERVGQRTGGGTLTAGVTPTYGGIGGAVNATLNGGGELTVQLVIHKDRAPALSGSGSLATTATYLTTASAAFTGDGNLSKLIDDGLRVTAVGSVTGAPVLAVHDGNSVGSMTASWTQKYAMPSSATGDSAFTATLRQIYPTVTALTGVGVLTAVTAGTGSQTAAFTGSGTLSASVVPKLTAALSGSGALSATAILTDVRTAALTGAGVMAATAAPASAGTVTLTGTGVLTAVAGQFSAATATLIGAGILTAGIAGTGAIGPTLLGAGTLTATTSIIYSRSAALAGAGTLPATLTAVYSRSAALVGSGTLSATAGMYLGSFVTRDSVTGNLMLDGQRLKFSGCNLVGVSTVCETNSAYGAPVVGGLHVATHSEIDATLDSADLMNTTVARVYGNLMSVGSTNAIQPTIGSFNSAAFEPTDYLLQQCAIRGIRLIFSLVDDYDYPPHGKAWYTANTGGGAANLFFTRTAAIDAFKAHISAVLNRVNAYTGITYKNDPTILAWELGNELSSNTLADQSTWAGIISTHIKVTEGAQQLVQYGSYGITSDSTIYDTTALALPYVDIYSNHPYDQYRTPRWCDAEAAVAHSYGKAFVFGEYTWLDGPNWKLTELLSRAETSDYIDGLAYWELFAPLANFTGYTFHRPGDDNNMQTRGTQIADNAVTMASGIQPRISVQCSTGSNTTTNGLPLDFDSNTWTPQVNDIVVGWATFLSSGGIAVPAGWVNPLGGNTVVDQGTHTLYCVYHIVTTAEATAGTRNYTAAGIQGSLATSRIGIVLRGVDPVNPVDSAATTKAAATTTHVLAGLTGSNLLNDSKILSGVAKTGTGTYTQPNTWGKAGSTEVTQTAHVFARNAPTVAGTNVATTNTTPSAGSSPYASITVAFAAKPIVYQLAGTGTLSATAYVHAAATFSGTGMLTHGNFIDGGSPSSVGTDILDGGSPSSVGTDIINGGSP